jgi:hypothetical protein
MSQNLLAWKKAAQSMASLHKTSSNSNGRGRKYHMLRMLSFLSARERFSNLCSSNKLSLKKVGLSSEPICMQSYFFKGRTKEHNLVRFKVNPLFKNPVKNIDPKRNEKKMTSEIMVIEDKKTQQTPVGEDWRSLTKKQEERQFQIMR